MMMRAIKLKSSLLHRLVGDGGVGINVGSGVIGGDCADAKELLSINAGGVLCLPLEDGENNEPGCAIKLGVGAEVFITGSAGEDGVFPGVRSRGLGTTYVGIYSEFIGNAGLPRLSGTGTFRASAIAAASDEALGKRAAGSFSRQRKMTISSAGGMFGLMSTGESGMVVRCWDITAIGFSP